MVKQIEQYSNAKGRWRRLKTHTQTLCSILEDKFEGFLWFWGMWNLFSYAKTYLSSTQKFEGNASRNKYFICHPVRLVDQHFQEFAVEMRNNNRSIRVKKNCRSLEQILVLNYLGTFKVLGLWLQNRVCLKNSCLQHLIIPENTREKIKIRK